MRLASVRRATKALFVVVATTLWSATLSMPELSLAGQPTPTPSVIAKAPMGQMAFTVCLGDCLESKSQIYVMDMDGTGPKLLTKSFEKSHSPVWSPDSRHIAFVVERNKKNQIYVMNADGSRPIALTQSSDDMVGPTWAPDGKHILFYRRYIEDQFYRREVLIVNEDGTGQRRLGPAEDDFSHAFSPDGKSLVFDLRIDGNYQIFIMGVDGAGRIQLTSGRLANQDPSWSPDSRRIAFVSRRDGHSQIYVMERDGSNPVNLSRSDSDDTSPHWSPNGRLIAFLRDDMVWVMNSDGSNPHKIGGNRPYTAGAPSWSPDSGRLAFSLSDLADYKYDIYAVDVGCIDLPSGCTKALVNLTYNRFGSGENAFGPVWSPTPANTPPAGQPKG